MPGSNDPFDAEMEELLRAGQKIGAIRLYRQRTGLGLKESKDAVEAYAAQRQIEIPTASGSLGCLAIILVVVVLLVALAGWAWSAKAEEPRSPESFVLGADISWAPEQESEGIRFSDAEGAKDILAILKGHGFNAIRLRVFVDPKAKGGYSKRGFCDLEHTLAMARRTQAAGLQFLLDFHYSDTWADPGHQVKPAAWANLHGADLEKAVRDHTRTVMAALAKQGTPPGMVQIGNEISNGLLWPDGQVWKSGKWDVFCGLLKAGIAGAREVDPVVKIMLHLAWGGQNAQSRAFLDRVKAEGVEFQVLGQSYYPRWHGTLDDLKANLADLADRFPQDIMVVEYSAPHFRAINDIVHALPGGKGLGTYIWEPTKWEGPALFDAKGRAKPELDLYPKMAEAYQR